LPAVLQVVVSGRQVPPEQPPLQQASFDVQAPLSEVQAAALQTPPLQLSEQQSVPAEQAPPADTH
jgi:hypothetical protein